MAETDVYSLHTGEMFQVTFLLVDLKIFTKYKTVCRSLLMLKLLNFVEQCICKIRLNTIENGLYEAKKNATSALASRNAILVNTLLKVIQ